MADLLPVHGIYNGTTVLAYFRTSDVYGLTGGISEKVKIKKIDPASLSGDERIYPVKELLRTADLIRIAVRYKDSTGKRKSARILCAGTALSGVFGDVPAQTLTGVPYKIGAGASRGNITGVGLIRRATTY
jgi:hypothetical protein